MKATATWTISGSQTPTILVLADSPDPIPATNLRITGSRQVQEDEAVRAVEAALMDRGNRGVTVSFDTAQVWADIPTAETFALNHEGTMPPMPFLLALTAGTGAAATVRYLPGAVMVSSTAIASGATTRHSYTIKAPGWPDASKI